MGTLFVRLSVVLPALLLRWSAVAMTGGALLGTMPAVAQSYPTQGVEATPGTPAAFRELIVAETERWRMVIKSAGITADVAQ